jgi:hypothetical protein
LYCASALSGRVQPSDVTGQRGIAVVANRPFQQDALISRLERHARPHGGIRDAAVKTQDAASP